MRGMDPAALARLALLSVILATTNPNAAPPPAAPTSSAAIYVVAAGDTLYSIALKFNTTIQALQELNNLANPNTLTIGQRLKIPGAEAASAEGTAASQPTRAGPTMAPAVASPSPPNAKDATRAPTSETYTVQPGDTLASIAQQYGITIEELARVNNIKNVNLLSIGQILIIPATARAPDYPEGIAVSPLVIRQGDTVDIRVTRRGVAGGSGTFEQGAVEPQKFSLYGSDGGLVARIGISRCATFVGEYPVTLTLRDAFGSAEEVKFNLRVQPNAFPTVDIKLTSEMASLLDPEIMQAEESLIANMVKPATPQKWWNGAFRSPLDVKNPRISSAYGERRSYNGGAPGRCGHEGVDYAVDEGTAVYAPAGGVVVHAAPLKVRGNVIMLDHGQGVYSGFYHLSEIAVQAGQRVKPGDLIGKVGSTGFSTGDHLHWSMWVNEMIVDPADWVARSIP